MSLPAPDLDDRRFQQLVDDAKRLVAQRCPEWTDHNVSDPGVTLLETFADMVDQLIYRLNRVPERNYVRFLELIGLRLFPPTAARVDVTFWLSAAQQQVVAIPEGTQVATVRAGGDDPAVFATQAHLDVVPCELARVAARGAADDAAADHTDRFGLGEGFHCFQRVPQPGDALLVGLSAPVPSCAVLLRLSAHIEGVGVDPDFPPLQWEAWTGEGWEPCELERDGTGGLNRAGDIVVHVPAGHAAAQVNGGHAGWLRARVVEAREDQPAYSASPRIDALTAQTVGGTAPAMHAQTVDDEILGESEGVAGQVFALRHRPVVPTSEPVELEVSAGDGWQAWTPVDTFADSGPRDRHFAMDAAAGQVRLGPAVTEPDGSLAQHGAVPPAGARLRVRRYHTGGGRRGNVAREAISVLKSAVPFVATVSNRRPAAGGVDGETLEAAKRRGPVLLRTRNRAVTVEDYEHLAREAAPEVARVRCVAAGDGQDQAEAGEVRVLLVPAAADDDGRLEFPQLIPEDDTLQRIADYLDSRRAVGARVVVEPPLYQGVTAVVRVRAGRRVDADRLRVSCLRALYGYFHPLRGGPDGDGWPFGRPVHAGEVHAVLQGVDGVDFVEEARLFPAVPTTGERGEPAERLTLRPNTLAFSYGHQVRVQPQ